MESKAYVFVADNEAEYFQLFLDVTHYSCCLDDTYEEILFRLSTC